nr:hypothetical protein [uncultured Pseudogulbenkiania sp.]
MGAESTKHEIELAIARIRHGRPKKITKDRPLSIAAVAEEAGISNATIHNRYPLLAEKIRRLGKEVRSDQSKAPTSELAVLRQQLDEVKQALEEKEEAVKKLAIINLRMAQDIKSLQAELAGYRVVKLVKG